MKICQQNDQDTLIAVEEINQKFEKKENESLRPLLAVRKAYPALFDHPTNNLGFSPTIDRPSEFMQKLLQVSKGKIKNNIESESDKTYFYGADKKPIIHHHISLVEQHIRRLITDFGKTGKDSEKLKNEITLTKAAHCQLLQKYPPDGEVSYAALGGLGALGMGALADLQVELSEMIYLEMKIYH